MTRQDEQANPSIAEQLRAALTAHRAGQVDVARETYLAVLEADPDNIDATHLLGALALQNQDLDTAEQLIRKALALAPDRSDMIANLVTVLLGRNRAADALELLNDGISRRPTSVDLLLARADVHQRLGQWHLAVADGRQALQIKPDNPPAQVALALALHHRGEWQDAENLLCRALDKEPLATTHYSLGVVRQTAGQLATAEAAYRAAVAAGSKDYRLFSNLATVLRDQGRFAEALQCYEQATDLSPDPAVVAFNKALLLLMMGRFSEGWPLYEKRLESADFPWPRPVISGDLWDGIGEPAKRIALRAEQGIGDQIMFAQHIPALIATGMQPMLECTDRLVPLFARSFPAVTVLPLTNPPAASLSADGVDCCLPVGGLTARLRPTPTPKDRPAPYLRADPQRVDACHARYRRQADADRPFLVGLSWRSGNPTYGAGRTIALAQLSPLLSVPGCVFVCLQYGDTRPEVQAARSAGDSLQASQHDSVLYRDPAIDFFDDLDGLAAACAALDLVITIDNVTAHMAGALGVPSWVLLPAVPEWRWGVAGGESCWYQHQRLFRQTAPGDWGGVVESVSQALKTRVAQDPKTPVL